ncbi:MAG TPA: DNA primase large subunit PriL, partial [Candidatus Thermoplasmatota archaeon]|nr:DNA primase large subunit PriL [Candidatus Thermoplasmatota archaeon]
MDPLRLARYPFLPEASAFVAANGPALEDLLRDPAWARAREAGRVRLLAAVRDGEVPRSSAIDRSEALLDILSYVYARIAASASKDEYVVRRHALAESKRMSATLEVEAGDVLREVAAALGLASTARPDGRHSLHFADYLPYGAALKDVRWKLVSRELSAGLVSVDAHGLARLSEEAYRRRVERELPLPVDEDVAEAVDGALADVRVVATERKARFEMRTDGPVDFDAFPPCMRHILGMLQAGENAPHEARFAVTAFLHTLGMSADEIVALFAKAPDFREDLTRYQVEHITGRSSGTSYTPPGCAAMKTAGTCYGEDDWCRRKNRDGERYVNHP